MYVKDAEERLVTTTLGEVPHMCDPQIQLGDCHVKVICRVVEGSILDVGRLQRLEHGVGFREEVASGVELGVTYRAPLCLFVGVVQVR